MKRRHLIAALISALTAPLLFSAAHAEDGKHLFILSGQSNMANLRPEASFTPAVKKAFGEDNIIVIKDASSGKPIRRWYKGWKSANGEGGSPKHGDLYDHLMSKVNPAIESQKIASVTFVWMQGERDAKESHGEVYGASLIGLIKQLEKDLNWDDINFVIGRLSDCDMENKLFKHWTLVRDEQVNVAKSSPRGAWIDTDDLEMAKDNLHYSREGYKIMGQRFADKAIHLIKK